MRIALPSCFIKGQPSAELLGARFTGSLNDVDTLGIQKPFELVRRSGWMV